MVQALPPSSPPYTQNTIALKVTGHHEEAPASAGGFYPGSMLQRDSNGAVAAHGVLGGISEMLFAVEDGWQGHWFQDVYNTGDLVFFVIPRKGDRVLALVNALAPAITQGNTLISAGDGTLITHPGQGGFVLYSNTASSAVITNTTTETAFNKSYTLPANTLQPGDVIHVRAVASCPATNSTDTLTLKLKIGTTVIVTTGAVDVANGDVGMIDADIIVRDIGATGHILASGTVSLGPAASANIREFELPSTVVDTTVTEALTVTATWSVANAGDQVQLDVLEVSVNREFRTIGSAGVSVDNSAGTTLAYVPVNIA